MAEFAVATFSGTDGTDLPTADSNWTEHPSFTSGQHVITDANRARPANTSTSGYYHSGVPASADYEVSLDLYFASLSSSFVAYICGRMSTSAYTYYYGTAQYGAGWKLNKVVGGSFTQLGSTVSQTFVQGSTYNYKLRMDGDQISLYTEGGSTPTIGPITDTAITDANRAGIRSLSAATPSNSVGIHIDNFSAADLTSGGGTTLAIANSSHGHVSESVIFTQNHILAVNGGAHSHTATNITLGAAITLAIANTSHGHVTQALTLSQQHLLAIANSLHTHNAQNVVLISGLSLDISNGSHGVTSTNITLSTPAILQIQSAAHGVISGDISLAQLHYLIVQNTVHSLLSSNIAFAGAVTVSFVLGPDRKVFTTVIDLEQLYEVIADRRKFMLYQLSEEFSEFVLEKDRKQFTSSEDNQ